MDTPIRVISSQAISEACNLMLLVPTWLQAHAVCALSHSLRIVLATVAFIKR